MIRFGQIQMPGRIFLFGVPDDHLRHRVDSAVLQVLHLLCRQSIRCDLRADINTDKAGFQIDCARRHQSSGAEDNNRQYRLLGVDGDAKRSIVKRLQQILRAVLRSLHEDKNRNSLSEERLQTIDTLFTTLRTRTIYNDCRSAGDPSEDRNLQQFFFCQGTELTWQQHGQARNIEKGCVVTDVDVSLSFPEIFFSEKLVADESQLAEDPAPQPKKSVTYRTETLAEHERKNDPG